MGLKQSCGPRCARNLDVQNSIQELLMKARALALAILCAVLLTAMLQPLTVRGISSTVVISEFRVRGPLGGNDEFIELHNVSSAPVNITGMLIRGSNSSGFVSTRATIGSAILQPGCYYLVANNGANGYSGAVPANQTYGTGVTDDGGIALTLSNTTTIIDQVGMSAGSAFGEGTRLTSLGSSNLNRSYERKPGGAAGNGTDTDNNASDFQLITPSNPQNSTSTCISNNPTNPSGTGAATPASVSPGDSTKLTVTVTPGSNPASTGLAVTGNLSAIGGSATQQFFDDGIQGGDTVAGDNVFTYFETVSASAAPGVVSLPVTITDAQSRTGNTSISLTIVAPLRAIHEIQGNGQVSPFNGQLVRTRGIVTARKGNGFFLQTPDSDADGDPATSEGIFVFTAVAPPVPAATVGNYVEVNGTAQEFIPGSDAASPPFTEITGPAVSSLTTGNPLPVEMVITAADTNPVGSLDQLEKYEAMRVRVDSLTTSSPTLGSVNEPNATGSSNGVFYGVITGMARPFREPGIGVLDPLPAGSPCCVPRWDANPELLRVDSDGQTGAILLEVTSGATVSNLVGVLDFGFRTYTILPDPGSLPSVTGLATAAALPAPGTNEFTVSSMNLERFFDTVNDPGVGDPVLTATAFANRLNKLSLAIRNVMNSPDVIGVEEVENLSTLQAIASKLNADTVTGGAADPGYLAYLEEGNDIGGIDVGFLVKASRVVVNNVTQVGKNDTYINPNNGLPELLNDRPPLVLEATILSTVGPNLPVTVIVNHLRSLNGVDDPVDGNRVRTKRGMQAEFLANYVQQRQAANANEEIIVVGDFNAFQFNDGYVDGIGTIQGTPTAADEVVFASSDLVNPDLMNLLGQAAADERYSYVFDGNAQVLDHVMVTGNIFQRLNRFDYARNNADFPESLRSNAARSERYSDHDHPVAYFALPPISVLVDIKPGSDDNTINLGSNGNVPVAILSTPDFDAGQIDPATVTLAGAGTRLRGKGTAQASLEDVNGDGLRDLVVHIETSALQLTPGATQALLEGKTFDGKTVRGTDSVRIVP